MEMETGSFKINWGVGAQDKRVEAVSMMGYVQLVSFVVLGKFLSFLSLRTG